MVVNFQITKNLADDISVMFHKFFLEYHLFTNKPVADIKHFVKLLVDVKFLK